MYPFSIWTPLEVVGRFWTTGWGIFHLSYTFNFLLDLNLGVKCQSQTLLFSQDASWIEKFCFWLSISMIFLSYMWAVAFDFQDWCLCDGAFISIFSFQFFSYGLYFFSFFSSLLSLLSILIRVWGVLFNKPIYKKNQIGRVLVEYYMFWAHASSFAVRKRTMELLRTTPLRT